MIPYDPCLAACPGLSVFPLLPAENVPSRAQCAGNLDYSPSKQYVG